MNYAQHRQRGRGWESYLVDGLLLSCMLIGVVVAMLVLVVALGCALGIFSF